MLLDGNSSINQGVRITKVNHFLKPQSIDVIFQTQFVKKKKEFPKYLHLLKTYSSFVLVLQHEKALIQSALFKPSFNPVIQKALKFVKASSTSEN